MTEPEQQTNQTSTHEPVVPAQPQYGQYASLQYGAMESQFPPNYDPYLYGRPDPQENASQSQTQPQQRPQINANQSAWNQAKNGNQPNGQHILPNGMNLDDPNQNIYYGHWDGGAIIAFIFALLLPCPILPAIMGLISMRRTRIFHMKGRGLAIAAVIINVIWTIGFFYLMAHGISMNDFIQQYLPTTGGTSGTTSGDSVSI